MVVDVDKCNPRVARLPESPSPRFIIPRTGIPSAGPGCYENANACVLRSVNWRNGTSSILLSAETHRTSVTKVESSRSFTNFDWFISGIIEFRTYHRLSSVTFRSTTSPLADENVRRKICASPDFESVAVDMKNSLPAYCSAAGNPIHFFRTLTKMLSAPRPLRMRRTVLRFGVKRFLSMRQR